MEFLEPSVEFETEGWKADDSKYTYVEISEVMENGKDRYKIITTKKKNLYESIIL